MKERRAKPMVPKRKVTKKVPKVRVLCLVLIPLPRFRNFFISSGFNRTEPEKDKFVIKSKAHPAGKISIIEFNQKLWECGSYPTQVQSAFNKILQQKRYLTKHVICDLNGVDGILGADELGSLVTGYNELLKKGVDVKLIVGPGRVMEKLVSTKLTTIFQIFSTLKEALASY